MLSLEPRARKGAAVVAAAMALLLGACAGEESGGGEKPAAAGLVTAAAPEARKAFEQGRPIYTCPMHPSVVRAERGGCPACGGMPLVEHKGKLYACPKHPEQVSTAEEAVCAVCGSKTEAVAPPSAATR